MKGIKNKKNEKENSLKNKKKNSSKNKTKKEENENKKETAQHFTIDCYSKRLSSFSFFLIWELGCNFGTNCFLFENHVIKICLKM